LEKDIIYCPICKQANKKSKEIFYCKHCGNEFPIDRNNQVISKVYRKDKNKIIPKKKKKKWRIISGFSISLLTYLAVFIVSLIIYLGLSVITNLDPNSIPFTFFISFSSLVFLIIPILWIQRYYPRKLTIKQRFSELGIPLERYSRTELIREILLGFLLGLISVFLVLL